MNAGRWVISNGLLLSWFDLTDVSDGSTVVDMSNTNNSENLKFIDSDPGETAAARCVRCGAQRSAWTRGELRRWHANHECVSTEVLMAAARLVPVTGHEGCGHEEPGEECLDCLEMDARGL